MSAVRRVAQTFTLHQARHWCFTLNNYDETEISMLRGFAADECDYMVWGKEIAPTTQTPHLQGFFSLTKKSRAATIKKKLELPRIHLEAKGKFSTIAQAVTYCKKEGNFEEIGEIPREQGEAGGEVTADKWGDAKEKAVKGNFLEVDPQIFVTHYTNLQKINTDFGAKPEDLPDQPTPWNDWLYGPTGTGKSFTARAENPDYFTKPINKWWNRYTKEEAVIIEDLGPYEAKWIGSYLKVWADRYVFPAEVKGGFLQIRPKKIIVTSNYTIRELFPDPNIHLPLERRFNQRLLNVPYRPVDDDVVMLTNATLRPKKPALRRTQGRSPYTIDYIVDGTQVFPVDIDMI